MQRHKQLATFQPTQKTVLTIGTFDGLHLGHQKILETVCAEAKQLGLASVLLTFHPHPRRVLFPDQPLGLIQTQEEKLARLAAIGLDHVVVLEFSEVFAQQTAAQFVEEILIKGLNAHSVIIGYDHQFGHDRQGNLAFLRSYEAKGCFEVKEIPVEQIDEVYISSSKIRKAIEHGQIAQANAYLGQPYQVSGFVSRGLQNGRSIGFPTANVQLTETEKILPADGVYAGWLTVGINFWPAAISIGTNPTFEGERGRQVEAYALDQEGLELYDKNASIEFGWYLRPTLKFDSLEELLVQMKKDCDKARELTEK